MIVDPVKDVGNVGRTGIGFENIAPKSTIDEKTGVDQGKDIEVKEPMTDRTPLRKSEKSKDKLKLFAGNASGLTEAEICAAVHPIAMFDVQINAKGFSFASFDASDAVELFAKYSFRLTLSNGRKIYFHPPKDKKEAVAFAAAGAKMPAFAPKPKNKTPALSSIQEPLRYSLANRIVTMQLPPSESFSLTFVSLHRMRIACFRSTTSQYVAFPAPYLLHTTAL